MQNSDVRSQRVINFLQVLKLFEYELFSDAYYDINYRRNINLRNSMNLPKDGDLRFLIDECNSIMSSLNAFEYPSDAFVSLRSPLATVLIMFNARRGWSLFACSSINGKKQ